MKIFKYVLLLIFIVTFVGYAQREIGPIDRIVAIVGDEIIMLSQIREQAELLSNQNPKLNPADIELQKKILFQLITEKLLLIKAKLDSIVVTDEEINQRFEIQLKALVNLYGSEKRLEEVYNMPLEKLKSTFREQIRNLILIEKIKEKNLGEIKATEREVLEFYNQHKDTLPTIPEQVELYHIVKSFKPTEEQIQKKFELAKAIRDSIVKTGNFEYYAKKYSEDYFTAGRGGELDWATNETFMQEVIEALSRLQIREISQPVATPLGFQIFQILERKKDSLLVRHILFKILPTVEDIQQIKSFLDSLRSLCAKGYKFEDLARQHSDDQETRGAGGFLGIYPVQNLPEQFRTVIDEISEGGISKPFLYKTQPSESYHIIYKKKVIPEHRPTPETDYKELEQLVISYKQKILLEELLNKLKTTIYWEIIDPSFK
ncbi:MAG: peptidylprolyl isomerase [Ignavibacteria bacterium]|nr:peptidylprolyl isomerase [Ignavibacteria bacterium]